MIDDITGGSMRTSKEGTLYEELRGSEEKVNIARQLNAIEQNLQMK